MNRPPRVFTAGDILSGRIRMAGYPFRYIVLGPSTGNVLSMPLRGRSGTNEVLDEVLSAVELLESQGWETVTVEQGGMVAILRQRGPA